MGPSRVQDPLGDPVEHHPAGAEGPALLHAGQTSHEALAEAAGLAAQLLVLRPDRLWQISRRSCTGGRATGATQDITGAGFKSGQHVGTNSAPQARSHGRRPPPPF